MLYLSVDGHHFSGYRLRSCSDPHVIGYRLRAPQMTLLRISNILQQLTALPWVLLLQGNVFENGWRWQQGNKWTLWTTPQCIHTVNILCLIGFIIPFRKSVVMCDFVYVMYYYYYFWNFRGSMLSHCRMISVACNYTEGEHMVCVLDFKRETGLWHAILSSVLNGMHVIFIPYALMKISPASWMHMITKYRWRIYFLHILISDWNYHIVSFFGLILIN